MYLSDGACTCVGPNAAFVDAASGELPFNKFARPSVTRSGIADVCRAVSARGGATL